MTGAGGFLQAAFFGYTQLRIDDNQMVLKPSLPALTHVVKLRGFSYLGNIIDLQYDSTSISFEVRTSRASSLYPLEVIDTAASNKTYKLLAGERIELQYTPGVSTFTVIASDSSYDEDNDHYNNEKKSDRESLNASYDGDDDHYKFRLKWST